MKLASLEAIFRALQEAKARYLVVGGLAVVAHGYVRMTKDIDLVLDLSAEALPRALQALGALGYRPMLPVDLSDFARPEVVGLPALIALKRQADRPQDRADIDKLRRLHPGI